MENKSTEKWARECQATLGYISGEIYEIVEEILDQLDMATSCKYEKSGAQELLPSKWGGFECSVPTLF